MAEGAFVGATIGFIIIFGLFWLLIAAVSILAFIFWIYMIVDAAQRKFKQPNDQIVWILVIVLAQIVGAIIYYFVIKKPDKH